MSVERSRRDAVPDGPPLFLVGCVRSGTTLTRDLLRRVPDVICPEETHFLRWSEPFRTPASMPPHTRNEVLRQHRVIDGVSEEVFADLLTSCLSKAELQRAYVAAFARAQGVSGPYRWIDKTPQNIYGGALILSAFPSARLLHIVRNPLNVVASMLMGRQVSVPDVHGAINYWCEAVQIAATLRKAAPDRIMDLRYEDLVADVPGVMAGVQRFAGIVAPPGLYARADAHPERDLWRSALGPADRDAVVTRCGALALSHGYDLRACVASAAIAS